MDAGAAPGAAGEPYWGLPSATLDWCEPNYVVTQYVAEFWNTTSNVFFVLLAIFGLYQSSAHGFEWRYAVQYVLIAVLGIGSAAFHGTLLFEAQQLDETPMVWAMLAWLYLWLEPELRVSYPFLARLMPAACFAYGVVFAALHWCYKFVDFFQIHFGAMVVLGLTQVHREHKRTRSRTAKRIAEAYVWLLLIGFACWLLDYHLCHIVQPLHLHALWHVFVGWNSYCGPVFAQFRRAEQLAREPHIRFAYGIVPYVAVKKVL